LGGFYFVLVPLWGVEEGEDNGEKRERKKSLKWRMIELE